MPPKNSGKKATTAAKTPSTSSKGPAPAKKTIKKKQQNAVITALPLTPMLPADVLPMTLTLPAHASPTALILPAHASPTALILPAHVSPTALIPPAHALPTAIESPSASCAAKDPVPLSRLRPRHVTVESPAADKTSTASMAATTIPRPRPVRGGARRGVLGTRGGATTSGRRPAALQAISTFNAANTHQVC
jgi:hypothetical protein